MGNNTIGKLCTEPKHRKLAVSIIRGQNVACSINSLHVLVWACRIAVVKRRGKRGVAVGAGEVNGHAEADLAATLQVVQEGGDSDLLELGEFNLPRVAIVLFVSFLWIDQGELLLGQKFLGGGLEEKEVAGGEENNNNNNKVHHGTSKAPMKSWSP